MRTTLTSFQSLSSQALRQLSREITTMRSEPPEGVRVIVDEEDLTCLEGLIQGPSESSIPFNGAGDNAFRVCIFQPTWLIFAAGTPYEGGYYRVRFEFTSDYPNVPPKCKGN